MNEFGVTSLVEYVWMWQCHNFAARCITVRASNSMKYACIEGEMVTWGKSILWLVEWYDFFSLLVDEKIMRYKRGGHKCRIMEGNKEILACGGNARSCWLMDLTYFQSVGKRGPPLPTYSTTSLLCLHAEILLIPIVSDFMLLLLIPIFTFYFIVINLKSIVWK